MISNSLLSWNKAKTLAKGMSGQTYSIRQKTRGDHSNNEECRLSLEGLPWISLPDRGWAEEIAEGMEIATLFHADPLRPFNGTDLTRAHHAVITVIKSLAHRQMAALQPEQRQRITDDLRFYDDVKRKIEIGMLIAGIVPFSGAIH